MKFQFALKPLVIFSKPNSIITFYGRNKGKDKIFKNNVIRYTFFLSVLLTIIKSSVLTFLIQIPKEIKKMLNPDPKRFEKDKQLRRKINLITESLENRKWDKV